MVQGYRKSFRELIDALQQLFETFYLVVSQLSDVVIIFIYYFQSMFTIDFYLPHHVDHNLKKIK